MAFFNFPFHITKDTAAVANEVQTNFDQFLSWVLSNVIQKDGSVAMEKPLVLAPGDPAAPNQGVNKAYVDAAMPAGSMMAFAGTKLPTRWLWCDGTTYTETSQPTLFGAIGRNWTAAGIPTGSFQVPNMQTRVPAGAHPTDAAFKLGKQDGGQRSTELINHGHSHNITASSNNVWTDHLHDFGTGNQHQDLNHSHSGTTDDGGAHNHGIPHGSLMWRYNPNGSEGATSTAITGQRRDNIEHADVGTHTHTFGTGWPVMADGSGNVNMNHTHSGTTSGTRAEYPDSKNHSHTITIAGGVTAFGEGTVRTDKNLPPYAVVNYIIYSGIPTPINTRSGEDEADG